MSIQELSLKFKGFFSNTEYQLTILIIVVSLVSFYLGRSSVAGQGSLPITTSSEATVIESKTAQKQDIVSTTTPPIVQEIIEKTYVASKGGTKYHLPWCPGAKQIKEENKVWFASKADAEKAGYTPAANCKGI